MTDHITRDRLKSDVPSQPALRRPDFIRVRAPSGETYEHIHELMRRKSLHTVCEEAHCPNMGECWQSGTATFLILGDICTRSCGFCDIRHGRPSPLDPEEPQRVAQAVKGMELKHAVITSVDRDDLPDGGAAHFAATIHALRARIPGVAVEVLIPDLQGDTAALDIVLAAKPDILNHNLETVARLQPAVRPQADYARSLGVLRHAAQAGARVKSGLMLGMGETRDELLAALHDLRAAGVTLLTLGQYLAPSAAHHPVARFVPPEEFAALHEQALALGFVAVAAGPQVRSSYHAGELVARGKVS